jgi:hypothetical protein
VLLSQFAKLMINGKPTPQAEKSDADEDENGNVIVVDRLTRTISLY